MPCAWAWRVVETRAYAATRISVLLSDQRQAGQAALPGQTRQQLAGLIPPALAVLARAVLAADGPGPGHRALLPAQHRYEEQISANATADATRSSSAAPAAHRLPRHRPGHQRPSGSTTAERRPRHTEEVTYTIDITKSNLPQWDITPET